jgi:hypothetical protein
VLIKVSAESKKNPICLPHRWDEENGKIMKGWRRVRRGEKIAKMHELVTSVVKKLQFKLSRFFVVVDVVCMHCGLLRFIEMHQIARI